MYASRDDIVAAYGQDLLDILSIKPGDEDGSVGVARALTYADGLIDARLSVRFALPLATIPQILKDIAVDLAVERLASDAVNSTDMIRDRARSARRDLVEIAEGRLNLGLPAKGPADSPRPVVASPLVGGGHRDKLFTRDRLRGL